MNAVLKLKADRSAVQPGKLLPFCQTNERRGTNVEIGYVRDGNGNYVVQTIANGVPFIVLPGAFKRVVGVASNVISGRTDVTKRQLAQIGGICV